MAERMEHPDEATWERLALDELEPAERDAWFDHITGCERCSQVWRGVLALQSDARAEGLIPATPTTAASRSRSMVAYLAVAATLVVAAGGALLLRQEAPGRAVLRSSTEVQPVEGLMMAYDAAGVPTFVWTPVPSATQYRVELFTDDGRPVWTREAGTAPLPWPADAPRATGTFRWRVEARRGDDLVARSPFAVQDIPR